MGGPAPDIRWLPDIEPVLESSILLAGSFGVVRDSQGFLRS